MKTIILLIFNLIAISVNSSNIGWFSHTIKNSSNDVVYEQPISVKISILSGSSSGEPIYVETHQPITGVTGYISLEIGQGETISGSISNIYSMDRINGTYFLKTEIDLTGEQNYSLSTPILEQIKQDDYANIYGLTDEPFFEGFDGTEVTMLIWGGSLIFILAAIRIILYIRNRSRTIQIAKEIADREAKQKKEQAIQDRIFRKEQAIQDEIFRKEQAKLEEEKQKELVIWNRKSPIERAKIKFKEMEDAIHNLDGYFSDVIFREWESEFEKYVAKNEIINAKDKIFQLRLLDSQQRQRQREINNEREHQREVERENERRRGEQAKDNRQWYCPNCRTVVPGRDRPSDRNCIGGKSHLWQLRS